MSENEPHRVELTADNHYHRDEDGEMQLLRTGATFVPTESERENFSHKFEPVDEPEPTPEARGQAQTQETPVNEPPVDPTELTVDELRDALTAGDYSDAELGAIQAAEEAGDSRSTALDAVREYRSGAVDEDEDEDADE